MVKNIYSGAYRTGHCQGIAIDKAKGCVYYSFTTAVVKTDMEGHLIGSAYGLLGHLGCIAFNPANGKLYGSLEYKHDAIGKGILSRFGNGADVEDAFYIAIFDADKLNRVDMDAVSDGIMKTVYLKEVADDYNAEVVSMGKTVKHRYGCSGIDGTAVGPAFGAEDRNALCLYVAYGIYGDNSREDNDYQILLQYDLDALERYAMPISQENMHKSGPEKPEKKYFIRTGNTCYGVQNLEYDAYSDKYFLSVYPGSKPTYPNPPLFAVDRMQTPKICALEGTTPVEYGETLVLDEKGRQGYPYNIGQTGIFSMGDGYFYISHHGTTEGKDCSNVKLYRFENGVFSIAE